MERTTFSSQSSAAIIATYSQSSSLKKYDTANWSLRQGDEEVNKRTKQKNTYLSKLSNISVWKQIFFNPAISKSQGKWKKKSSK